MSPEKYTKQKGNMYLKSRPPSVSFYGVVTESDYESNIVLIYNLANELQRMSTHRKMKISRNRMLTIGKIVPKPTNFNQLLRGILTKHNTIEIDTEKMGSVVKEVYDSLAPYDYSIFLPEITENKLFYTNCLLADGSKYTGQFLVDQLVKEGFGSITLPEGTFIEGIFK
jgi:hypothetical protein